ncbi:hypothetical protein O3P69_014668 [Scylla paramamosain]|uniref:Uncharacterized protein n=1 Tax=Scylla paramamosain TaxID=85552 RepID=A0AAW0U248_SCYPA
MAGRGGREGDRGEQGRVRQAHPVYTLAPQESSANFGSPCHQPCHALPALNITLSTPCLHPPLVLLHRYTLPLPPLTHSPSGRPHFTTPFLLGSLASPPPLTLALRHPSVTPPPTRTPPETGGHQSGWWGEGGRGEGRGGSV